MDFIQNTTTALTTLAPATTEPKYVAYLCLLVSVMFLGSNFLPIKKFETGDGMFFNLILTTSIWSVGFVVNWIRGFPPFYALPMLGGFLWSTGNLNTVPIIKLIGMGLGPLFWNTVLLIVGWCVARFGWFGVEPEVPTNPVFNYVGVGLAAISGLVYIFIQNENKDPLENESLIANEVIENLNQAEIIVNSQNLDANTSQIQDQLNKIEFVERLHPNVKKILGISLACFSGVLYAFTFTPALYVQDNYKNASPNALDYVFSLYTGILVTQIVYFSIYCAVKKNKPQVFPKAMLPAIFSGLLWGIGNCSFFVSNNVLTQAVTFPIVSSGPSAIALLWGIVLFKEIKGLKNFLILAGGFTISTVGAILCGLSK